MINEALRTLVAGNELSADVAAAAMSGMMAGEATPVQMAAFLTALAGRGATSGEITSFAKVMRSHAVTVSPGRRPLVDTCGTGGGAVLTFNISTTAAFVVAGAGVAVAKHGNRAMTSRTGSADLLEALGVRIDLAPEMIARSVDEVGVGFLFAQAHHPAMRHIAPVRRELPFRTVFNCLGPLTNPAGAEHQVIGVYDAALVPLLSTALCELGCRRGMVVYGADGLDELSTLGRTLIASVDHGQVRHTEVVPEELGLRTVEAESLAPGEDAAGNAAITRAVLEGEPGARREIVLLNAAAALQVAGKAANLREGIAVAAESIDSGAAAARLAALTAFTGR